MLTIFIIALKQMVVLFLFMAAGYFMRKKEVIKEDVGKVLSTLELYIFMPCLTIESFAKYCTPAVLMQQVSLVGLSTVIVVGLCIPLSRLLAKHLGKTDAERDTYRYSLCFPNSGYMGYPIIGAVFGKEMLMNAMLFCIPFNVATYTYGMFVLMPQKGFSWKKLVNPVTISVFVGMAVGLCGIPLPDVLNTVLEMGGECMAPVAMLLTGYVLAERPLPSQLRNGRAYIASACRLMVIPALAAAILYLLNVRGEAFLIAVTVLAMPMGLNSIVVPESYGGDVTYASQSTLISNLLGVLTIPIVLGMVNYFS